MRYAIYFSPPRDHALTRLASSWMGRDAFSGEDVPLPPRLPLSHEDIAYKTAAARRYGFHATLKAPFEINERENETALLAAADGFCSKMQPFEIPALRVTLLDGFIALTPFSPSPDLDKLADDVVTAFDGFRAPIDEAEFARRNPDRLSIRQVRNLREWGYPYVFEDFRFHMTLTGPVEPREAPVLARMIEDVFAPVLVEPLLIDRICIFVEPKPAGPFRVLSSHAFGVDALRRSA